MPKSLSRFGGSRNRTQSGDERSELASAWSLKFPKVSTRTYHLVRLLLIIDYHLPNLEPFIDYLSPLMSLPKSIPGDTPIKQNSAASGVFINGTLDEQRAAVMNDLGNIPEVTVDFMLDNIVPNSGIDVERTIRELKRNEVLLDAGWKEFDDKLPKKTSGKEQIVFSKMGTIYQGIIGSTAFDDGSSRTPTLVLGATPDIAPVSETKVKSRPDGCGQLSSNHPIHTSQCGYPPKERGDYHWFNIAYVEEYKKRNSNGDLNNVCPIFVLKLMSLNFSERSEDVTEFTPYDACRLST